MKLHILKLLYAGNTEVLLLKLVPVCMNCVHQQCLEGPLELSEGISSDKLTINVLLHWDDLHSVRGRVDE